MIEGKNSNEAQFENYYPLLARTSRFFFLYDLILIRSEKKKALSFHPWEINSSTNLAIPSSDQIITNCMENKINL